MFMMLLLRKINNYVNPFQRVICGRVVYLYELLVTSMSTLRLVNRIAQITGALDSYLTCSPFTHCEMNGKLFLWHSYLVYQFIESSIFQLKESDCLQALRLLPSIKPNASKYYKSA